MLRSSSKNMLWNIGDSMNDSIQNNKTDKSTLAGGGLFQSKILIQCQDIQMNELLGEIRKNLKRALEVGRLVHPFLQFFLSQLPARIAWPLALVCLATISSLELYLGEDQTEASARILLHFASVVFFRLLGPSR